MEPRLPAPRVIVLIGPAGAGKCTSAAEAGATHSIVALPDVALPGSTETFAGVIETLGPS